MMIHHSNCFKYEPDIGKLTKANSCLVDNRVVYIVKKEYTGKASKYYYFAYDYETKIQLAFNTDKDKLIEYLQDKKLGVLDGI